jgi:dihydroneopterin triphosphate diphosphatase
MPSHQNAAVRYKIPQSVLVVIHTMELDVLLIRRADVAAGAGADFGHGSGEFWQSVTGSKDFEDEPFGATAVREVLEETGIACGPGSVHAPGLLDWGLENVYDIYPRWLHRYAPGVRRNTERLFGLCLHGQVPVRLSPREHDAHMWLPWHEAARRCYSPSNAEAILMLPRFVGA